MDTHIDVPSDFQKEIALLQSVNLSLASAHKQDTALIKKLEAQVESLQEKLDQAFSQGIALSHEFMAAYEKIGIMAHVTFESSLRESGKQMEGHLNTLGSVEAEDNNDFVIRLMQTEDWGNIPARAKELLFIEVEQQEESAEESASPQATRKRRRTKEKPNEEADKKEEILSGDVHVKNLGDWIRRFKGGMGITLEELVQFPNGIQFDAYCDGRLIKTANDIIIPVDENGNAKELYRVDIVSTEVEIVHQLVVKNHTRLFFKEPYVKKADRNNLSISSTPDAQKIMEKLQTALQQAKEDWLSEHFPDCHQDKTDNLPSPLAHEICTPSEPPKEETPKGCKFREEIIPHDENPGCKKDTNPNEVSTISVDDPSFGDFFTHTKGSWSYTTKPKKKLFDHSFVSPSLLSWFLTMRFWLFVPNNRTAHYLWNNGLCSPACTYNNWTHLGARPLRYIYHLLRDELKTQGYVHADESPVLVFREPGRENKQKAYFWFYVSTDWALRPVCIMVYHPGRKGEFAQNDLEGWFIKLIRDAFPGYNGIESIIAHCLCNDHSRRYFWWASMYAATLYQRDLAKKIVKMYDDIFKIEREVKNSSPLVRLMRRQKDVRPLMEKIAELVDNILEDKLVYKNGQLYRAATYFKNNSKGLQEFLWNPNIPATNMKAEHMVKPFALYRRNSLFFGSPKGAEDAAIIMSVMRTAELNGLDVEAYLCYVFEHLRGKIQAWEKGEPVDYDLLYSLLPWAEGPQKYCRAVVNPRAVRE